MTDNKTKSDKDKNFKAKKAKRNDLKKVFESRIFKITLSVCLSLIVVMLSAFSANKISAMLCGKATKPLPIYSVDRDDKKISITFDCAWGNEYTQKLLDIMDEYKVKSTFFAVSFWAEKYPDDLKSIVERGHEVGSHSKTHSHMNKLSAKQVAEELDYSKNAITSVTGQQVELFRAPFGEYNGNLLSRAKEAGLFTIQWDVDSLDWKNLSAKDIALRVTSKVKSGSIILCHNNGLHTAESLPLIFSTLIGEGYKFVKVSELIYRDNYVIENDGKQVKLKENI